MRIELSKEQYRNLVEMVMAGNWLINSCRAGDEVIKQYEDTEQHLFSFYSRFETEDLIQHDNKYNKFFPIKELEDKIMLLAEEYNGEIFWDELIERLAEKEVLKKHKNPTLEQKWNLESKYEDEFINNGLERLEVDWNKHIDMLKP